MVMLHRMRVRDRRWPALLAILLLVMGTACGSGPSAPPPAASHGGDNSSPGSDGGRANPASPADSSAGASSSPDGVGRNGGGQGVGTTRAPQGPVRAGGEDTVVVAAPGLQTPSSSQPPPATIAPPQTATEPAPQRPTEAAPPTPDRAAAPPVQEPPVQARPAYNGLRSGTQRCNGSPVIQNGEVVFGGLPPGRLQITYDTAAWHMRRSEEH